MLDSVIASAELKRIIVYSKKQLETAENRLQNRVFKTKKHKLSSLHIGFIISKI
jgi:hypothetical protein